MAKHASELANRCAGLARTLSYNEDGESVIKHTLRECSYFIDQQCIRVHAKREGKLMINGRGKARFMTWRERAAYWLLRNKTEIRP